MSKFAGKYARKMISESAQSDNPDAIKWAKTYREILGRSRVFRINATRLSAARKKVNLLEKQNAWLLKVINYDSRPEDYPTALEKTE